jgi:Eukaryotic aspartyl protease
LWLNDLDANTGQILFGGVNTDKYHGSLQTVPILKAAGRYVEFLIALTGVSGNGTDFSSSSLPAAVLLDSGTTLMYLPNDITMAIWNEVQAVTDVTTGSGTAYVPCALANTDKTIDFTFSGIKISVPFNELVLQIDAPDGSGGLQFNDGTPACFLGISPDEGGTSVLGDTFLRSAYVVYDLANNEISLAQTNFNSTTDNIKEIGTGPTGVPDATPVPHPVTTAKGIGTGAARLAAAGTPTGAVVSTTTAAAAAAAQRPAVIWGMGTVLAGLFM